MRKKAKTIQFQIPEPCHENWNKMHPLPGGRFCDSCEKTIVDFTQMTDSELVRFYKNNNQKVCGRFRSDQLNKDLPLPTPSSPLKKWKSAAAVVAGLLAWNASGAQYDFSVQTIPVVIPEKAKGCKPEKKSLLIKVPTKFTFQGIVKDKSGEGLIGANVLLGGISGTSTDFDGKFKMEISTDWETFEVTFSYLGYATQVIEFDQKEISKGKNVEVILEESSKLIKEVVVTGYQVPVVKGLLTGKMVVMGDYDIGRTEENKKEKKKERKKERTVLAEVYPNPFISSINLKLDIDKKDRYLLHLYNASGQLIWAETFHLKKGMQELHLDFSNKNLAQGNYFLRITDSKLEIQTKKIFKVNDKGGESATEIPGRF